MSLLIALGVVGGVAFLCALYILGLEIAVFITAETKLFKTKVQDFIEKRNEKNTKALVRVVGDSNIIGARAVQHGNSLLQQRDKRQRLHGYVPS